AWRLGQALFRFRPDVIHAHTFFGILYGMTVKPVFNVPLVHTVPCLFSQMREAHVGWLPRVYTHFHGTVDRFFTGMPRELAALDIAPAKITRLPGAVDLHAIDPVFRERDRHR